MALSSEQISRVEDVLKKSLRSKFEKYRPEADQMPFHHRLLGKDRMALYSFIQSLNTTFGAAVFEPVAVALASTRFKRVERKFRAGYRISERAFGEIQRK